MTAAVSENRTALERYLPDERGHGAAGRGPRHGAAAPATCWRCRAISAPARRRWRAALIRAMADDPALEVPSPTFTLVQSYETRVPLHHFDLYRLSSPAELDELGLRRDAGDGCRAGRMAGAGRRTACRTVRSRSSWHMKATDGLRGSSGSGSAFERIAPLARHARFPGRGRMGEASRDISPAMPRRAPTRR